MNNNEYRLMPVALLPAIRDALVETGKCLMPDHVWAAIIEAFDRVAAPERSETPADEQREPAPGNSLPNWSECNRIIENHEFRQRAEAGLEGQVLDTAPTTPEPTELHRFIYEYDDADSCTSAWFLHRLEKVIAEASRPAPAVSSSAAPSDKFEGMFMEACEDLAAINEALGLDPNDGGAEPIIAAIDELKERAGALAESKCEWPTCECALDIEHCKVTIAAPSPTRESLSAAVVRDAERYRFLRNPETDIGLVIDKVTGEVPADEMGGGGYRTYGYRAGDDLDHVIDAAMFRDLFREAATPKPEASAATQQAGEAVAVVCGADFGAGLQSVPTPMWLSNTLPPIGTKLYLATPPALHSRQSTTYRLEPSMTTLPNEVKERKLNPCPFCGGDAIEDRDCAGFYNYRCGKCKCSLYGDYEHHMTGRAAWNRRATLPPPAEPVQGVSDAEDGIDPLEQARRDGWCEGMQEAQGLLLAEIEDAARMDWLAMKVVNVRDPLRYGSRDMFWASPTQDDGDPYEPSDLRAQIDAARSAQGNGGGNAG